MTPSWKTKNDLTGQRFGKWTVTGFSERPYHFDCVCDCGTTWQVAAGNLRKGVSRQCSNCRQPSSEKYRVVKGKAEAYDALLSVAVSALRECDSPHGNCADFRHNIKSILGAAVAAAGHPAQASRT